MNTLETNITNALEKRGWTVLRRGWPDFLIYREGQAGQFRVAALEVKSDSDHLSEQQEEMHRVLRAVGLPVHVLRPDFVNKRRMGGKTCAVLTASEKLDVEQQVSSLKAELARLRERIQQAERVLEETNIVFEPERKMKEEVMGNAGITQPTEEQLMRNAVTKMDQMWQGPRVAA